MGFWLGQSKKRISMMGTSTILRKVLHTRTCLWCILVFALGSTSYLWRQTCCNEEKGNSDSPLLELGMPSGYFETRVLKLHEQHTLDQENKTGMITMPKKKTLKDNTTISDCVIENTIAQGIKATVNQQHTSKTTAISSNNSGIDDYDPREALAKIDVKAIREAINSEEGGVKQLLDYPQIMRAGNILSFKQDRQIVGVHFHRLYADSEPLMGSQLTDEEIIYAIEKMKAGYLRQCEIVIQCDLHEALQYEKVPRQLQERFRQYMKKYPTDNKTGQAWTTMNPGHLGEVAADLGATIPPLGRWTWENIAHVYAMGMYVGYNGLTWNKKIYIRTAKYHRAENIMTKEQFARIMIHEVGHRLGLHHPIEKAKKKLCEEGMNLMCQQRDIASGKNPSHALRLKASQVLQVRRRGMLSDHFMQIDRTQETYLHGISSHFSPSKYEHLRTVVVPYTVLSSVQLAPTTNCTAKIYVSRARLKVSPTKAFLTSVPFEVVLLSPMTSRALNSYESIEKVGFGNCWKEYTVKRIGKGKFPRVYKGSRQHLEGILDGPAYIRVDFNETKYINWRAQPVYLGIRFTNSLYPAVGFITGDREDLPVQNPEEYQRIREFQMGLLDNPSQQIFPCSHQTVDGKIAPKKLEIQQWPGLNFDVNIA